MKPPEKICENDLHAYVDGELDAEARRTVEAWLTAHPEDAQRVADYRRQKDELHGLFDGVLNEAVPENLSNVITNGPAKPMARPPVWRMAVAAAVMLLIGAGGGWSLRGLHQPAAVQTKPTHAGAPTFVRQAVGAHLVYTSEVRHPVEVAADQQDHLVKWLSKRLGHPLKAPDLRAQEFDLMGGRLLADADEPAAQFMYQNNQGRRLTVYVRAHEGRDTAFRFARAKNASAFYWIDKPFAYILTGDVARDELLELANTVYRQLEK